MSRGGEGERTADALRESESRFRALFSAIDEGYCLCEVVLDAGGRPVDYRFLEANPLFEEMTGLVDAVGRTALELVPDLERRWVETYARVALGGEPLRFEEGSEAMGRWFDVFAMPVEPRGRFALVFKDVTQRRRADDALRESEAAERRAREQAELLAEVVDELEAVDGVEARVQRLVDVLVPRVADVALVEAPGEGQPVALAHHDGADVERVRRARLEGAAPGSQIAVALDLQADVRGVLVLARTDPERRPYGQVDLDHVQRVADRAAVLLARARRRKEEHEIAIRLQQALLPDELVQRPGVQVAARYEAGSALLEVGGDWYDSFALAHGEIGLAVGDVVGHGLEAAAEMGRLRIALAALAPHSDGPGELLSHLDAFATGPDVGATACCAILDPSTGLMRYASAGHPPMLVVGPDGTTRWLEGGRSSLLHGVHVPDRPEASVVLEPGTLLVLYSDGLVERRGEHLSAGLGRLERAARTWRDALVEEVCDRLVVELGVDRTRDDDVVVLCVRLSALAPAHESPA